MPGQTQRGIGLPSQTCGTVRSRHAFDRREGIHDDTFFIPDLDVLRRMGIGSIYVERISSSYPKINGTLLSAYTLGGFALFLQQPRSLIPEVILDEIAMKEHDLSARFDFL